MRDAIEPRGGRIRRAASGAVVSILLMAGRLAGQATCEPPHEPTGTLGIAALECITDGACAVNERDEQGWFHWFTVEPVIQELEADDPGRAGRVRRGDRPALRAGDVIVAIDGHLITTSDGGRRLASLRADTPVELRVRRGDRELDLVLTPVPGCNTPRLTVREPGSVIEATE